MSDSNNTERTPVWMTAIIIICMLPVLGYPYMLSSMPAETVPKYLVWFYPLYVLLAGICAWWTYPQRRELSWIILALLLLTHLGMYTIL